MSEMSSGISNISRAWRTVAQLPLKKDSETLVPAVSVKEKKLNILWTAVPCPRLDLRETRIKQRFGSGSSVKATTVEISLAGAKGTQEGTYWHLAHLPLAL